MNKIDTYIEIIMTVHGVIKPKKKINLKKLTSSVLRTPSTPYSTESK